jgi:hypothetical protein
MNTVIKAFLVLRVHARADFAFHRHDHDERAALAYAESFANSFQITDEFESLGVPASDFLPRSEKHPGDVKSSGPRGASCKPVADKPDVFP